MCIYFFLLHFSIDQVTLKDLYNKIHYTAHKQITLHKVIYYYNKVNER